MATRKELKEPDEFLEALQRIYRYTLDHIKVVALAVGILLTVVVGGGLVYSQMQARRVREAAVLNQAVALYHQGEHAQALTSLESLSRKADLAGVAAELYMGNVLYDTGEYDKAAAHFARARELAEAESLPLVGDLALYGQAYAEMARGDAARAETLLASTGTTLEDYGLLLRARLALSGGHREQAVRLLEELTTRFPDSPWIAAARGLQESAAP